MHFTGDKTSTRFLEQNILNLAYAQFDSDNEFGIPNMLSKQIENLKDIPLQGFNFALKTKNPENIGVHFFLHDYQFERVWKYPDRYIDVLKKFAFVLSPDFSVYCDMPKVLQIYNIYRNRWVGRYWQENGINVIPTVTWSNNMSLEFAVQGIPKHSTIAISTMGEGRHAKWVELFAGWNYILETLEPSCILLYGKDLSANLEGNIVVKNLISSKVAI